MVSVEIRLRALRRRVFAARFAAAGAEAALAVAAGCAVVALAARLVDRTIPLARFAWTPVLPVVYALWRARREVPGPDLLAAWLDRRGGLGGLLVTSRELDAAAWTDELSRRYASAAIPTPPLGRRVDLYRVLAALALSLGLFFLPAVVRPSPRPGQPAVAVAAAELRAELESLRKHEAIDRAAAEDLAERLERLEEKLAVGEPVSWSEVDALERRLEEARELRSDAMESARDAAAAAAGAADAADAADAKARAEELAKALERANAAGALEGLSPELRDRLNRAGAAGATGAESLSPEELRDLAADLAEALQGELEDLAEAGLGDPAAAKKAAAKGAAEWEEAEEHVHGPDCEGGT